MEKMNSSWKPCMPSKARKNQSIGVLILALLILGWAIVVSVCIAIAEKSAGTLSAVIVILTFGVGQLLFFSFVFVIERRKYQMSEDGITILYYGRKQKFYPWSAFRKIVVCDVDHATKFPDVCEVVIRLSAMDEPNGPHSKKQKCNISGIATWRKYGYFVRNFSNILLLDYSPELLDELVRVSGLPFTFSLTSYGKAKLESFRKMRNDK